MPDARSERNLRSVANLQGDAGFYRLLATDDRRIGGIPTGLVNILGAGCENRL
jgi:hypothetical protein